MALNITDYTWNGNRLWASQFTFVVDQQLHHITLYEIIICCCFQCLSTISQS